MLLWKIVRLVNQEKDEKTFFMKEEIYIEKLVFNISLFQSSFGTV